MILDAFACAGINRKVYPNPIPKALAAAQRANKDELSAV
jgi:hypothetical protein